MFDSLFSTTNTVTTAISLTPFVVSVATALALGLVVALCYCFKSRYNKGFVTTLAMLPAIVAVVIAMVNGNVGAGVAVAGAFSLVRFRSVAGSARDIGFIFLSMAIGLVCGMGYVGYLRNISSQRLTKSTRYTTYCELVSVKTVNMGSLYRLVYNVGMKDATAERAFLDDLRCRNGNMEISISRQETIAEQL